MILSSETTANDAAQMLDFYKQHFAVVDIVSCSRCGAALAFECTGGDGMGLSPNELGKYVINIGNNLLAYRVRLDEAPTGERMVGYQCGNLIKNPNYDQQIAEQKSAHDAYEAQYKKDVAAARKKKMQEPVYDPPLFPPVPEIIECGNDTRISIIEEHFLPETPANRAPSALSPFEKHQIREKIATDKSYKPDFRKVGNIKHFESFQVERL